jgi:rhamnulokinase
MPRAIDTFCKRTGQQGPRSPGETMRCCLESLALKYRWVVERLEEFRGSKIDTIHIVGGGTQNRLLCQLTADATGRLVVAGPIEATAIGNVLTQAIGRGQIGSLEQAREVVRRSFELITYVPDVNQAAWEDAYVKFLAIHSGAAGTTI